MCFEQFNLLILQLLIFFYWVDVGFVYFKNKFKKKQGVERLMWLWPSHTSLINISLQWKKNCEKGENSKDFEKGGTQINPKLNSSTWKLSLPSFFVLFSSRNQLATPPFEKTRALLPPRDSPKKPHRRSPSLCQTRAAAHWHRRPAL